MTPPKEPEPALAAPGVGELLATPQPSISGPRVGRRARNRSYSHVRLEVELEVGAAIPAGDPLLERLLTFLAERKAVEQGTLIMLTAATLHALSAQRFRRVDHWESSPGGWLPPPGPEKSPDGEEPVGHLLATLERGAWTSVRSARSFSARLSDLSGARVDVTVRRLRGARGYSLTLNLWGSWTSATVRDLEGALASRLPVVHSTMTKFRYE
jgi:hypothetical protein